MTTAPERAIGKLEGKIDLMLDEQARAAEARKQSYEKLETLDRKITATESRVESIDERLEKVEKTAADINKWRERLIGMQLLIVFVAGSLGAAGLAVWKWLTVKLGL